MPALAAAVVVLGGYYVWQSRGAAAPNGARSQAARTSAPVPVVVAKVRQEDFPVFLEGLGTVQAYNSVLVRTRVDGEIMQIAVKEGQDVKAGDLIAQVDPRPFQAALDQASAKKTQDEATLKNAGLDLQRYSTLAQKSFATGQQLDTQKSTVASATAQIAADQAAIESAETQLGYARVTAPISGRTGIRLVDQGNILHTSDTGGIITIQQLHPISLIFTAPQEDVTRINAGQAQAPLKVEALNASRSKVLSQGELAVVNNTVDTATGTIQLKATFPNVDNKLWPGLSVTTNLLVETLKNVATIPNAAIQHGPDGLFVFVVEDDKARVRKVKIMEMGEGTSVVASGLKVGETVVTDGQYRLQDGSTVKANDAVGKTADAG